MSSSYTWCNSTRVTHFLNRRFMRDLTDKNKTPLSITTLNTYLINSLLIISLLIKYFLCLFFSLLIKSFFPFSLQFLLHFYFLNFFLPKYHFPYTCFTKCSSKNIHGRSCKWHQTTKWGDLIGMYYLIVLFFWWSYWDVLFELHFLLCVFPWYGSTFSFLLHLLDNWLFS